MATPNPSINNLAWLRGAGSFLQVFGLLEQGRSARIAGERARAAAEFEAWQAEEEAGTAIAIAQRQAMEERRQARLVASRALAVAAASGGGVSDPTIVNLISRAKGEGAYRAAVAMYEGEAKARKFRLAAAAGRAGGAEAVVEGIRRQTGYTLAAAGAGFVGFAKFQAERMRSLYNKYGQGGPSGDAALIED